MTIFLLIILYLLISNPNIVAEEVYNASILWFTILLPTMYPSFVILDLIYYMPLVNKLSARLVKPFSFLFNIHSSKGVFLILLSLLCGAPASTKLISTAYDNKELSFSEYENLICAFSTLSLPYICLILNKLQFSIILYYSIFLILSFLWMKCFQKKEKTSVLNAEPTKDYIQIFFSSIKKNTDILLNILGILIIFRVLIRILLPENFLLYPYLEILGGLNATNNPWIVLSALGFLGISVHLQILSITRQLRYSKFLGSRLLFSLLGLLAFF